MRCLTRLQAMPGHWAATGGLRGTLGRLIDVCRQSPGVILARSARGSPGPRYEIRRATSSTTRWRATRSIFPAANSSVGMRALLIKDIGVATTGMCLLGKCRHILGMILGKDMRVRMDVNIDAANH